MDFILDLFQSWQIASQATETASLEERVKNLEHQLQIIRELMLALLQGQRPDLAAQMEAASRFTASRPSSAQNNGADMINQAADLEYSGEWDEAIAMYQRVLEDSTQREHHGYARNSVNQIREKQKRQ